MVNCVGDVKLDMLLLHIPEHTFWIIGTFTVSLLWVRCYQWARLFTLMVLSQQQQQWKHSLQSQGDDWVILCEPPHAYKKSSDCTPLSACSPCLSSTTCHWSSPLPNQLGAESNSQVFYVISGMYFLNVTSVIINQHLEYWKGEKESWCQHPLNCGSAPNPHRILCIRICDSLWHDSASTNVTYRDISWARSSYII